MIRMLILCTGNSCRSQMAEGILKNLGPELAVFSAGTRPAGFVHPDAIAVMREIGVDIGGQTSKPVDRFLGESFDYVITVCDHARDECPVFIGQAGKRMHLGFEDPGLVTGTRDVVLGAFRDVRNRMRRTFTEFYETEVQSIRKTR